MLGRTARTVVETLLILGFTLGAYALLSSLLSLPLWTRLDQQQSFTRWDAAVAYVPWLTWLLVSNLVPKSFSNVLIETVALAALAPLAALAHIALRGQVTPRVGAVVGVAIVTMFGIGLAYFVPVMPE